MKINNPAITHKMFIEKFYSSKHKDNWFSSVDIPDGKTYNPFFRENGLDIKQFHVYETTCGGIQCNIILDPPLESLSQSVIVQLYHKL